MQRTLWLLLLIAPVTAQAGDVKISVQVRGWWPFGTVEKPAVSPHHLSAPPPRAKDACTFVAGVRHCPRAEPK
jgi:hypothetical protein